MSKMNRLTVYSYLTRYPFGHTGSGCSQYLCQKETKNRGDDTKMTTKLMRTENSVRLQPGQLTRHTTHPRTPGPPSQDLTSGWKQPESDNYTLHQITSKGLIRIRVKWMEELSHKTGKTVTDKASANKKAILVFAI